MSVQAQSTYLKHFLTEVTAARYWYTYCMQYLVFVLSPLKLSQFFTEYRMMDDYRCVVILSCMFYCVVFTVISTAMTDSADL